MKATLLFEHQNSHDTIIIGAILLYSITVLMYFSQNVEIVLSSFVEKKLWCHLSTEEKTERPFLPVVIEDWYSVLMFKIILFKKSMDTENLKLKDWKRKNHKDVVLEVCIYTV